MRLDLRPVRIGPMGRALPAAPEIEEKIRDSFARQEFMRTLGATLTSVAAGEVQIEVTVRPELGQQHGFMHAGVVVAILDSACGYAALTVAEPASEVLTVELKANLLAPVIGEVVRATGRVVRRGRTLTVCQGNAVALGDRGEKHVAVMLATMSAAPA